MGNLAQTKRLRGIIQTPAGQIRGGIHRDL
jgi:hypothetical protein